MNNDIEKKLKYIKELEVLNSFGRLNIVEIKDKEDKWKFTPIKNYLNSLLYGSKPESALARLMIEIVNRILNLDYFSEVALKKGIVDLALQESIKNPVLIELKPNYYKKGEEVRKKKFIFEEHEEQIKKYLQNNNYVILTNLDNSFIFNQESLLEYKPFIEIKFTELLKRYLEYDNFWESVRRLEDDQPKPELEAEFFTDLKKWYNQLTSVNFIKNDKFSKEELIVLFLNKIIFTKTLEDYGLIPYKFLENTYFDRFERWQVKGVKRFFRNFFEEVEDWFWEYYDTELFSTKIWDYIEKDEINLLRFKSEFETILGFGQWEYTFGKGMVHYNYRLIDEDVFGKAYETFIAEIKKDSGIYYTPTKITQFMSQRLVKILFESKVQNILEIIDDGDYDKAYKGFEELTKVAIIDPSSGSGSFLIKILREIHRYYLKIEKKTHWATRHFSEEVFEVPEHVTKALEFREKIGFNNPRELISKIILNHIFALDIDERAIETAKTNMWKEAVKLEPPIFNFRRLPKEANHILPNLGLNFISADTLFDLEINEQVQIIHKRFKDEIKNLIKFRKKYLMNPFNPEIVEKINSIKGIIRNELENEIDKIHKPALIVLEFYFLYFDEKGNPLKITEQGFSGVINNPPWEEIYPVKKEIAAIGKYSMDYAAFDDWFQKKLKRNKKFAAKWEKYKDFYKNYSNFISENYKYHTQKPETSSAMRTHLNYFKVFVERNLQLIKENGFMNILIPSSFQTDEGSFGLRKLVIEENNLIELFSFENRGYLEKIDDSEKKVKLFPDVDNRFKFSLVLVEKNKRNTVFQGMFYLLDPADLYLKKPLKYDLEMIKQFSPQNLSIMEFSNERDYELCKKIKNAHPLLGENGFHIRREFNVSDDSKYLNIQKSDEFNTTIYEGKMIHQFNHRFSRPNYYMNFDLGKKLLLDKEIGRIKNSLKIKKSKEELTEYFINQKYVLDFETYRLVYRAVAATTNERTLISSIIPSHTFTVNSLNYLINANYKKKDDYFLQEVNGIDDIIYLMALFNSVTLNYYLRNKISLNLNMFYLYELPIPDVDTKLQKIINKKSFDLIYHFSEKEFFEDLRKELGFEVEKINPIKERAELEVMIAKELFKLDKEDWEYLCSTYIYGGDSETKKELDAIIDLSKKIFEKK